MVVWLRFGSGVVGVWLRCGGTVRGVVVVWLRCDWGVVAWWWCG